MQLNQLINHHFKISPLFLSNPLHQLNFPSLIHLLLITIPIHTHIIFIHKIVPNHNYEELVNYRNIFFAYHQCR